MFFLDQKGTSQYCEKDHFELEHCINNTVPILQALLLKTFL